MLPGTDQNVLKKLGKYDLIEIVGRGAMGEVYKAQDPLIGRLVALKTITSGLAGRPDLLERFQLEARSAGTMQHPNIVTVFELGQEGQTPFIAMEFLEGESLENLIERRPALTVPHKLSHIVPVCRALDYAHKRGIVHRDIKPANVMITKDGRVKVVDFGIARLMDSPTTQTSGLIGTICYMSPQQIAGEPADARSDIWAVGAMLYELLTFKRPFDGTNHAALMMNIASADVLPAPVKNFVADCGPALEALVSKMLAKDTSKRYQSMEHVLRDLEPIGRRLLQRTTTATVVAGQDLAAAKTYAGARSAPQSGHTVYQATARTPVPAPRAAAPSAPSSSFVENAAKLKRPVAIGLGVLVLAGILSSVLKSLHSAVDNEVGPAATPVSAAPDVPAATPARAEPVAPGVIATTDELSRPWAAKEFLYRNKLTGESTPAMVVRLPQGGYWGFSLIEPYGPCRLEYVTDLQKLAKVYGYRADHPLIADTCNNSLFDLMRYGGPESAEVRGAVVHGFSVRPPLAIEIEERGNSIVAVRMEE